MPITLVRFFVCSLVAASLLAFSGLARGDEAEPVWSPRPDIVMTNAAARDGFSLSGEWHYSIDPYRDGLYGFHGANAGYGHQRFDPRDVDAETRESPAALFEYDMRRAPTTTLPGAWMGHAPEMRHYQGLVWYARSFDVDVKPGERYFIRMDGANYHTRVYVNGQLIGEHEGGFTAFTLEATYAVKDGENWIALGVDSKRTDASVPPPVTDWETYGGVTRDIRFIRTPETFIDDYWVRLSPDGKIRAEVWLNGPNTTFAGVTWSLPGLEGERSPMSRNGAARSLSYDPPDDLCLWTPQNPCLHEVRLTAGNETLTDRIGFRTIETDGTQILLNGEPIYLRGISMHEEELGSDPVRNMTEDNARALFTEIKEGLNGNFVRLAHYPHSETTLRLADEMGLLVWSEIPVYWRIDWDNPETLKTARRMLAENIYRDRNRASVILWSVGNETPESDDRNAFMARLVKDVRAMDDTRLVTAALLTQWETQDGALTSRIKDPLAVHLDVLAVNTYAGWYGPTPLDEVDEIIWPDEHGKPVVFSELGAGAYVEFSDPELMRKFSVEYQAEYYRQTLAMADNIPQLQGMSPWILKDFLSPRRQHPIYQEGWNRKGLISETGERKPAFDVLAEYYRKLAEAN